MIIEGLVTSLDFSGRLNVAPMGPIVEGDFESIVLRPFQPSTTFDNLSQQRCGVFHVVDEIDVIARAAIGCLEVEPDTVPAETVAGRVLVRCCRWFEFQVTSIDTTQQRSVMSCRIVHRGERRPYLGMNRARNAVIEAAILATRIHLIPGEEIQQSFRSLRSAVEKTGNEAEFRAFQILAEYVAQGGSQKA